LAVVSLRQARHPLKLEHQLQGDYRIIDVTDVTAAG